MERDERARDQGTERDREAQDRAAGTEAVLHLGVGIRGQGRVHVPRFERPAVERPEDALEDHRGGEQRDRIGDVQEAHRGDSDEAREDEHGTPAERVRQPAGRELEEQHHEALEAEDDPDLGQRQAARQGEQDHDRDEQAGRQPAQADQDEVAAPRRAGVERGHRSSPSSGKAYR